jgi:hypothetical protein
MKDELCDRLGSAIQEVLGGLSPLSARAGTHILRFIATSRADGSTPPVVAAPKTQPRPKTPENRTFADASGEIDVDAALGRKPDSE